MLVANNMNFTMLQYGYRNKITKSLQQSYMCDIFNASTYLLTNRTSWFPLNAAGPSDLSAHKDGKLFTRSH